MADYNVSAFPVSFNDPTYAAADQAASSALGIPAGWLNNIRTKGEKSNADQVSSAGARTPYQITPDTRAAIIKQTGVDPWLNPNTAAYGAAYLLKQSLDRNGGNPILATAEYHGGTDQANWGPRTMAYVKRVTGSSPNNPSATPSFASSAQQGAPGNPYTLAPAPDTSNLGVGMPNANAPSLSKVFDAYKSGQMDPQSAADFEADVNAGKIMLPRGMQLNPRDTGTQAPGTIMQFGPNGQLIDQTPPAGAAAAPGATTASAMPQQQQAPQSAAQVLQIPQGAVDAFNSGKMPPDVRAQMQADIQGGRAALPQGATLTDPDAPPQSHGLLADAGRQLGLTARDALQAAGSTVGLAYDPIAAVLNKAGSFIGHDPAIAPLGAQAASLADRLGLPQPVGSLERGVNAAAQGAAEAAGFAGAGKAASEIPGIVGQLGKVFGADAGKQITAMAAGQAAAQHAKDAGYSPAIQAAVNLGTMALTLGGAAAVEGVASRASPLVNDLAQRIYGESKVAPAAAADAAKPAAQDVAASTAPVQQDAARAPAATAPDMTRQGWPTPNPTIHVDSAGNATIDGTTQAATASAGPAGAQGMAPAAATPAAAAPEAAAAAAGAVNPTASPLSSAAQQFMPAEELAGQARKAVGAEGAPFGLGKNTAREVLASQGAPDADTLAAAKRLGIEDNLQPDHLTANQAYRELAQAIKSTPGSLARADEMEGLQQVAQRGQQIIEDVGGTRDLSSLSGQVKSELMNTQQQLDQKAESLYDQIRASVPQRMSVDAPNVLGFIQQRAADLGGAKNLSGIEKMVMGKLTPRQTTVQQEIPGVVGGTAPTSVPVAQTVKPTYALLDDVRRDIGAGLKRQGPFKDGDTGLLKALYARVSDDQRSALGAVPGAQETFDAARSTLQMRKSIEDDLTSLYGKQLGDSLVGKLGTAMAALPKGDESKFVELMSAIPKNMRQQVTASGLGYAFGKATRNGDLNFKAFADWMDGLKRNSPAFNAVMGNLPADTRQQLLDLAKVSRGVANATRETIATGRIMAAREELNAKADGMMGRVLDKGKEAAVGAAVAGAAHIGGPMGAGLGHAIVSALSRGKPDVMTAADKLIVSPEFQQLAKSSGVPADAAVKAAANTQEMKRFFDLARAPSAANDPHAREQWLRGIISSIESEHNMNTNR